MYVCLCRQVREADVRDLGARGVTEPEALADVLQLADPSLCGRCLVDIECIAGLARSAASPRAEAPMHQPCDRKRRKEHSHASS